jgi:hypothetical protein
VQWRPIENIFTLLYVDDVRTSQETRLCAVEACCGDGFTLLSNNIEMGWRRDKFQAGPCEHGNEVSYSMACWECLGPTQALRSGCLPPQTGRPSLDRREASEGCPVSARCPCCADVMSGLLCQGNSDLGKEPCRDIKANIGESTRHAQRLVHRQYSSTAPGL